MPLFNYHASSQLRVRFPNVPHYALMQKLLHFCNTIVAIMGATSSLFFSSRNPSKLQNDSRLMSKIEESRVTLQLKLDNSIESWIIETKRYLDELPVSSGKSNLPSWLQHELLLDQPADSDFCITETLPLNTNDFLIKGVPQRPLYKEVAFRLFRWNQRIRQSKALPTIDSSTGETQKIQLLVPAEQINLEELESASISIWTHPPPESVDELCSWLKKVDQSSILRLLGMRHTIGSDGGIIPSRHRLLQACRVLHKPDRSKLTVAARARSKHAHRSVSQESFFGVAKGPALMQNEQTEAILNRLLEEAIWINRHRFVGLDEGEVSIEIRVLEGYGARWVLDTKDESITFCGFLEPQMQDGHERKWRH